MILTRVVFPLLLVPLLVMAHRHEHSDFRRHHEVRQEGDARSAEILPFSQKRFEKMLQKAILKIIVGELSAADQNLLKSFNYSHADIQAIRQHELDKKRRQDEEIERLNQLKKRRKKKFEERMREDLEAFNRKALEDYENLEPVEQPVEEDELASEQTLHQRFDQAMKPHVVFQIRHDDSQFDSNSDELQDRVGPCENGTPSPKPSTSTFTTAHSFLEPAGVITPVPIPYLRVTDMDESETVNQVAMQIAEEANQTHVNDTKENDFDVKENGLNTTAEETEKRIYKGLEWVGDDVYRVIPEAMDSYNFDNEETGNYDYEEDQIAYDPANDTIESSSPNWDMPRDDPANNLTSYERLVQAQRRLQGQKAIEDIKLRVLVMTGRFNHTSNQVQKERLTMFLPTCQVPKNTDPEAWSDPFSMNMHFLLNLTASDHIAAARLRIFNLPQENLTLSTSSAFDVDEEDEKKIRISVYYYTKPVKKHRIVKKRLMDSVVTSLTSTGNHLALDVRPALRFWRRTPRYSHGNGSNHGLVVQVEDQDGRPLKPLAYIQQPSCQASDPNTDEKAYLFIPALYVRACSRYVRVINGEIQTYYYCKKS